MTEQTKEPEVSPEIERLAAEYLRWEDKTVEARWEQGQVVGKAQAARDRLKRERRVRKLPLAEDPVQQLAARLGRSPDYLNEWATLAKHFPDKATLVHGISAKAHVRVAFVYGAKAPEELRKIAAAHTHNGTVRLDDVLAALKLAGATVESEVTRAEKHLLKPDTPAQQVASTVRRIVTQRPEVLKEVEALKGAAITPKDVQAALKVPEVAKEVAKDQTTRTNFDAARVEHFQEENRKAGIRPIPEVERRQEEVEATYDVLQARLRLAHALRVLTDATPSQDAKDALLAGIEQVLAYGEAIRSQLTGADLDEQLRQLIESSSE